MVKYPFRVLFAIIVNMNNINGSSVVAIEAVSLFMIIGGLFGLIIFVIWVWSMLAIIDSASNLKKFLELYEQKENRNYIVRNFTAEGGDKIQGPQENKAENDKVYEVSEGKPNRIYILTGIAVVLLMILGIVLKVYS